MRYLIECRCCYCAFGPLQVWEGQHTRTSKAPFPLQDTNRQVAWPLLYTPRERSSAAQLPHQLANDGAVSTASRQCPAIIRSENPHRKQIDILYNGVDLATSSTACIMGGFRLPLRILRLVIEQKPLFAQQGRVTAYVHRNNTPQPRSSPTYDEPRRNAEPRS